MKNKLLLFIIVFFFSSCTMSDVQSVVQAAVSNNPSSALKQLAKTKSVNFAINNVDKIIISFIKDIENIWGKKDVKIPKKKEYVKYLQNYKSRALVDFDKGIVTVETLEEKDYKKSLKNAIVTTLLLPQDPRAANLYDAKSVKLGGEPYLLGEIKDKDNKDIRYEWRANRFANHLLGEMKKRTLDNNGQKKIVYYVQIAMVKDHANIRVAKFKPFVKEFASKYNLSENLVYAIIKTESNFNQFAVSSANAYGLMQVVPTSAGRDAYKYVKGKSWTPSKSYQKKKKNNIELGSAYLKILDDKYLEGINNPISKEYCVISAYNTGSGNVLKTFDKDRKKAKNSINNKTPMEIYNYLIKNLPYIETRNYLRKVINNKKDFVGI